MHFLLTQTIVNGAVAHSCVQDNNSMTPHHHLLLSIHSVETFINNDNPENEDGKNEGDKDIG